MNAINKDTVLGLLRHLMTFGGGYMVKEGLTSNDDLTAAISAVVTLIGFAWSVYEKVQARKLANP